MNLSSEYLELSPGVRVELLHQGKQFCGLGKVEINGVPMRGSRRPMFVELRTPEGVEFFNFEVKNKKKTADGMILEFAMKARASGLQDWMVHSVRNLVATRDWAEPEWIPDAILKLHLRGIEKNFSGRTFKGFEYFYEYESEDHPIYRLLERSSWALGGSVAGNTFWLRNSFAPSICRFTGMDESYSTEWYAGVARNPNIFQFQPYQTNMESFNMTVSEQGQLLLLAPKLSHIRSFFEKPQGTEEILHWHEHCGDLASKFSSAPIEVLFCARPATRVELINLYDAVKNHISDGLHRQAGLCRDRITTYGVVEEWIRPDLDNYADCVIPKFLEAGVRCIFLCNMFQNNMNVWNVGNMCCTVDYKMTSPEEEEKLRRLCAHAKAGGATVQMWGNTSISSLDYILRPQVKNAPGRANFLPEEDSILELVAQVRKKDSSAKDIFVRNPSGAIEADHYTHTFMVLNLREPAVLTYWHRRWKEAHDSIGLGGIFLDSSFNLSSDKFHFVFNTPGGGKGVTADQTQLQGKSRPAQEPPKSILTMYFAHLQLIAEMQSYGYHYCGEDIGVFGLNRAGPPKLEERLNHLFLWGNSYRGFDDRVILDAGRNPDEVYFQGLAYRMMWSLRWNFQKQAVTFPGKGENSENVPTPWHLSLLRVFNEVEPLMLNRTLLEEEKGVVYESEGAQVLWAFTSFDFPLPPGTTAREILTNKTFDGKTLKAEKHHVYCIKRAGS